WVKQRDQSDARLSTLERVPGACHIIAEGTNTSHAGYDDAPLHLSPSRGTRNKVPAPGANQPAAARLIVPQCVSTIQGTHARCTSLSAFSTMRGARLRI